MSINPDNFVNTGMIWFGFELRLIIAFQTTNQK